MVIIKRRLLFLTAVGAAGLLFSGLAFSFIQFGPSPAAFALTNSSNRANQDLKIRLDGFQVVPSLLTNGKGTLKIRVDSASISYTLTYSGLSSAAQRAFIHFAQQGVNGGVMAFLCGGGGKPACPPAGGTVTGTITAADILAIPNQGLAAGDFAGAVRAIKSGNTYVSVHTTNFPAGEIRGQIKLFEFPLF